MVENPTYGQVVYFRNTGTANAAPFLSGTINCQKKIDIYWSVLTETGRRKLFTPDELFTSMDELLRKG